MIEFSKDVLLKIVDALTIKSFLINDWQDRLRLQINGTTARFTTTDTALWLDYRHTLSESHEPLTLYLPLSKFKQALKNTGTEKVVLTDKDGILYIYEGKDFLTIPQISLHSFPDPAERKPIDTYPFPDISDDVKFLLSLQDPEVSQLQWHICTGYADGWLVGGSPGCTGLIRTSLTFPINLRPELAHMVAKLTMVECHKRDRQWVLGDSAGLSLYSMDERQSYPYKPTEVLLDGDCWMVNRAELLTAVQTLQTLSEQKFVAAKTHQAGQMVLTVPKYTAQRTVDVQGTYPQGVGWAVNSLYLIKVLKKLKGETVRCQVNNQRLQIQDQTRTALIQRQSVR